ICALGIATCLQQMLMVRLGIDPIYDTLQSYGGRSFYTATPADWRPIRPMELLTGGWKRLSSLFGSLFAKLKGGRGKASGGPARVIQVKLRGEAVDAHESPRAKYLRELRDLEDQLRDAIRSEDF